jgi:hypothetical protein
MAYIGNIPSHGEFKKADSIVSSFNGTLTQFDLDVNTVNQTVGDATQLIVSLNGVIQEPGTAYTLGIGGGSVVFASAPVSTDTCHIVILGGVGGTSTVADGAVTASKLDSALKDYLEETFTADGTQTAFTLTRAVVGANTLLVTIDGIVQPSSAFTASGTTLTISEVLAATTNVRVVHMGVKAGVYVPANDSVTADMLANSINTDIAAKLPLAGGAMTGPITTNSTFDGVDVGARDGVLTTTTTTANAALPKAGGTMTGVIAGFTSTGIDDNATSTAITIDGSGNVLVGTTDLNNNNSDGVRVLSNGTIAMRSTQATANSGQSLILDRRSTDGAFINFKTAPSTTVGSIGSNSGTNMIMGTGATGIYFNEASQSVHPWNISANQARNGAIDLGRATDQFRYLYLNGGVVFNVAGGTGTSTSGTLDDYEEGSWNANDVSGAGLSVTTNRSWYVKVGSLVTISASVQFPSTSNSIGIELTLPFTSSVSSYYAAEGTVGYNSVSATIAEKSIRPTIENSGTLVLFYYGAGNRLTYADVSGSRIDFTVSYQRT